MQNISSLKINEIKALKSLKEILTDKFNILDLKLFGSKIHGDDSIDSDIDIMINLYESNADIISEIQDIIFEINLENDSFISPLIFNRAELEDGPLSQSPIYKVIQKEGIEI